MNAKWDAGLIADTVYKYITDYNISTVRALYSSHLIADISSIDPDL